MAPNSNVMLVCLDDGQFDADVSPPLAVFRPDGVLDALMLKNSKSSLKIVKLQQCNELQMQYCFTDFSRSFKAFSVHQGQNSDAKKIRET